MSAKNDHLGFCYYVMIATGAAFGLGLSKTIADFKGGRHIGLDIAFCAIELVNALGATYFLDRYIKRQDKLIEAQGKHIEILKDGSCQLDEQMERELFAVGAQRLVNRFQTYGSDLKIKLEITPRTAGGISRRRPDRGTYRH